MAAAFIRMAAASDLDALVALIAEHPLDAMPGFPRVDAAICRSRLEAWLPSTMIAEVNGQPAGVLILDRSRWWWSADEFIGDRVLFIRPEARRSTIARQFIAIAKQYAAAQGLPLVLGVISGTDIARKDRFYQRLGFTRMGGTFVWGLKP